MNQFEQLLTCAICLDRYRNPKLLPCQHSFCMEPCMDGLVDYVRRQVKCPECRAEHRIPYQGVQGFPTNVTLQRFLELHIEITGELPDPTSGQIMERCCVCSEKAYLVMCVHCDKKICPECKEAHMDILRREISRINNQVRRGLHRLQDTLSTVEKNSLNFQTNYTSVLEEIDEIYRRLSKALKDRTDYLRGEIDRYLGTETKNLSSLKDGLEQEISNIESNCDLADKYITEDVEWNDYELMDAKDIFLKTIDFIRNFECETGDYNRKIRFVMNNDPNQLVLHIANYGDLNIAPGHTSVNSSSSSNLLQPPSTTGPGLMRSKSDHRLATQFRQEERGYDDESHPAPRKFGERYTRPTNDRYNSHRGNDYMDDPDLESSRPPRSRFRSRFAKPAGDESDNDTQTHRGVRFTEQPPKVERERVLDTEDVARGPLSGISRLYDSPRVMQRLQEHEDRGKRKKTTPIVAATPATPAVAAVAAKPQVQKRVPGTQRQISEDDEICRIKKQNKAAGPSTQTDEPVRSEVTKPTLDRVATLKNQRSTTSEESDRTRKSCTPPGRKTAEVVSSGADSDESTSLQAARRATPLNASRRSSAASDSVSQPKKSTRSTSTDSSASSDSHVSSSSAVRNTGAAYTTNEIKQKYVKEDAKPEARPANTTVAESSTKAESSPKPFQSRFLPCNKNGATSVKDSVDQDDEEETETSSEEESETETEEDEEEPAVAKGKEKMMAKSDIGPLLARSAQARDSSVDSSRRSSRDDTNIQSTYQKPKFVTYKDDKYKPKVESETTQSQPKAYGYTSRFLNKNKNPGIVANDDEPTTTAKKPSQNSLDDDDRYPTGRARYMALKDRRSRLAKSKSTHTFANDDDEAAEETTNPNAYMALRGYGMGVTSTGTDLSRSKSTHVLKSRDNSPERGAAGSSGTTASDGAALSSWARYLKNKYGNKGKDSRDVPSSASASAVSRRLSLGLPLRNDVASSDDDSKNMQGSPTTPTVATAIGIAAVTGTFPRNQYLLKRRQLFKIGSRGSEPGCFTWPRGIAVGPDNIIVVADSSNHRVQVFDSNGAFLKEFGQYGNAESEFDCLAGVAVNRIGQYIIADRYNHRIQVFDPSGRFLRSFGSQGVADGKFNYPWGITTDALGFIYVCDKENHRIQVFQSDGTFVGKFGSMGSKPGQLEHPLYIAVSSTNRVIVSDSNNHRIQVFDVNGRVLSTIGTEGSDRGQFKFPRGVAVDEQGYIVVADSGNNRVQIFSPDGQYLSEFGCWGSGESEFKGLEGAAVMSNGNILVCDRENHRILAFSN